MVIFSKCESAPLQFAHSNSVDGQCAVETFGCEVWILPEKGT